MKNNSVLALSALIISSLLTFSVSAASRWHTATMEGETVALSPSQKVTLKIIKPKDGIWGHFIIPLTPEHTESLKKHRINPHYSFIPVFITIDKIERRSTGKVNKFQHYITIDVDGRQWHGLKKGKTLLIELPDGTQFREPLTGSLKAMKQVERQLY